MSRSCHRATFSSAAVAWPRSRRASPQIRSASSGLRLWGIALEPFWPSPNGSWASSTSVPCSPRTSSAIFSSEAATIGSGRDSWGSAQPLLALQQEVDGVAELERGGRVPDVAGREPDVYEARVLAELLLEAGEERDHLVLDLVLNGEDAVDVDAERADARHDVGGNAPAARISLARGHLHPEPRLVLCGLAPDTSHGGPSVPLDHGLTLLEKPDKW